MARMKHLAGAMVALIAIIALGGVALPTDAQSFGSNWLGEYFANNNFSGSPAFTNVDPSINFTWGDGSPNAAFIPVDNFSVRWSGFQTIPAGVYKFTAAADNGIRVTVNGVVYIDQLGRSGPLQAFEATATLSGDQQLIVVEYVHRTGPSAVQFQWTAVGTPVPTGTPGPTPTPTATGLPPIPPGALTATVIRASVLNVRAAPSLGADRLGTILRGQTYAVVGRDSDARWFLLQLSDKRAWAYGYYLFINGNEFNAPITSATGGLGLPPGVADTGVIAQARSGLKLRAEPSLSAPQTGRITWGGLMAVVGRTSDGVWWQVVWKGTVGWVYSPFLRVIEGDFARVPITR